MEQIIQTLRVLWDLTGDPSLLKEFIDLNQIDILSLATDNESKVFLGDEWYVIFFYGWRLQRSIVRRILSNKVSAKAYMHHLLEEGYVFADTFVISANHFAEARILDRLIESNPFREKGVLFDRWLFLHRDQE